MPRPHAHFGMRGARDGVERSKYEEGGIGRPARPRTAPGCEAQALSYLRGCAAKHPASSTLTSLPHTVHIRRVFPHILMDIPVYPCLHILAYHSSGTRCVLASTHLHTLAYSRVFSRIYCVLARVFSRICRVFSRVFSRICRVFTAYSCVLAAYSRVLAAYPCAYICVRIRLYQS